MAIEYKTPTQIADQYLLVLKNLKPEVNTKQTDSDWWIRSRVVGGVLSGVYADQRRIADDAHPQSARREALERHLDTYFGEGFTEATVAIGQVAATGTIGSTVVLGTQIQYDPNGNLYSVTDDFEFEAATGLISVQSVATGQNQNLLEGASLSFVSPPAGVEPDVVVANGNISDGRDVESNELAADRILTQIRTPLGGGKISDYQQFALDADPSVTSASVIRFPFGFGSVAIIITAGTTDIDTALDNGDPIVPIPSASLIQTVQDYIETQNPITDCATVIAPVEVTIDVDVSVRYSQGTNSTILSGQTLTQEQLVQREVKRAIYKTPPGGRIFGATGFVVASEIEEVIDSNLSDEPHTVGNTISILRDRRVENLSATGANRSLAGNEIAVPGVITVTEIT